MFASIYSFFRKLWLKTKGWKVDYISGNMGAIVERHSKSGAVLYRKQYKNEEEVNASLLRRYNIKHPNIVQYEFISKNTYIMPDAGMIFHHYWSRENKVVTVENLSQIMSAMKYLSEMKLHFVDLHQGNVCIDSKGNLRLIDLESIVYDANPLDRLQERIESRKKRIDKLPDKHKEYKEIFLKHIEESYFDRVFDMFSYPLAQQANC